MKGLSLTLVLPIALHEDNSDPLSASTARMEGHRMDAFLAYLVAGAPLLLAFGALLCVSVTIGAMQGLQGVPADAGDESIPGLVFGLLVPAAALPLTLVAAVLYAKLPAGGDPY